MKSFDLLLDNKLREVVIEFLDKLDKKLFEFENSVVEFILLDKNFLEEESPNEYPQYMIIVEEEFDRIIVDDIFFEIQDKYGWPYGHYFTNSYSRKNIFSIGQMIKGVKVEECYLDTLDIEKIIAKDYIVLYSDFKGDLNKVIDDCFLKLKNDLLLTLERLEIDKINSTIEGFSKVANDEILKGIKRIIQSEFCRLRGESKTYSTLSIERIKSSIDDYINNGKITNHLIYGRLNGSGKSQYMYKLMGYLYSKNYPFIFKEVFYFHYNKFLEEKDKSINTNEYNYYRLMEKEKNSKNIDDSTWWIKKAAEDIEEKTNLKPVIFIDEDDVDFELLKDYFIISGDKSKIDYLEDNWIVHDIIQEDKIDITYIKQVLTEEIEKFNIIEIIENINDVIEWVSRYSKLPLYAYDIFSVYHSKRLLSLVLLEGAKRYVSSGSFYINRFDVEKWKNFYWSKFLPNISVVEEFHCEYIIYDEDQLKWDPYVEFDPQKLIMKNA
ncbi:hypothetical protein [Sporosalibacterium faouarense]|uniref:hypothetical protein n=1 Tax=Sporosalibacterium faouarense TaxID=516123 RepID=UPI00192C0EB0|nr:hypothetical protein [Sporosalibacterium faouarense]